MKPELILTNDGVVHVANYFMGDEMTVCGDACEGWGTPIEAIGREEREAEIAPFVSFLKGSGNFGAVREELEGFIPKKPTCEKCLEAIRYYKSLTGIPKIHDKREEKPSCENCRYIFDEECYDCGRELKNWKKKR